MKIYFLIFFSTLTIRSFSQSDSARIESPKTLKDSLNPYMGAVTKDVDFPGGYANYVAKEIFNYISKNELKRLPEKTRVIVSVIITKSGTVGNFKVVKSCDECEKINQALKNLFLNMHGWSPALDENSNPVDRKIAIPIRF